MIGNQIEIPSLSCSPISDDESVCIIMKLHSVILEICLEGWVLYTGNGTYTASSLSMVRKW